MSHVTRAGAPLPFNPFVPLDTQADRSVKSEWAHPPGQNHSWPEYYITDAAGQALRRFTGSEARDLLSNKHVFFVGDSVTREQFDALLVLIHTGHPTVGISQYGLPWSTHWHCSEVGVFDSREGKHSNLDDCPEVRSDSWLSGHAHNKFYHNAEFNISLSHLGLYDASWAHEPLGFDKSVPYGPQPAWEWAGPDVVAAKIAQWFGKVDVLLFNVGIWRKVTPFQPWLNAYHSDTATAANAMSCMEAVVANVRSCACL